jgi:hypothetical protein
MQLQIQVVAVADREHILEDRTKVAMAAQEL